ncbi:Uncharacterized protein CLAVI_000863 [Candidatus Clavichlamydia salmonicola]|uniref:hypothetical protein n=1 Tax=Candidatus Clavichlamydia salmonicola TaxID=469812 RepID=UPI001891DDF0|nr:hypothetical protein [Candidatus Clavichlamydia salmonicola]MBF5051222.1 Uncharacterized protein [Candidatus Clavichlamydia salmonicola]
MKSSFKNFLFLKWKQLSVSLIFAIIIWVLVNQTITLTRTISDIPIRIINLVPDQTVIGLLPDGILEKKVSITLSGNKKLVSELRNSDLELVINAEGRRESWVASFDKRNLVGVHHHSDIQNNLQTILANDVFINLSPLVTERIIISVKPPIGHAPTGYQYLDVFPKILSQEVTGPLEPVKKLKQQGLELCFNMNNISKKELSELYEENNLNHEISFLIPEIWKQIPISFKGNALTPLNDPHSDNLRIVFLRQELIALEKKIPVILFFPKNTSTNFNPHLYELGTGGIIEEENGFKVLSIPLFVKNVSRLFLDIVSDHLLLAIVISNHDNNIQINHSIEVINHKFLENTFVKVSLKEDDHDLFTKAQEEKELSLRLRFQEYLRELLLYTASGKPLNLNIDLNRNNTVLLEPHDDKG